MNIILQRMKTMGKGLLGNSQTEADRAESARQEAHRIKRQLRSVDEKVLELNELTKEKLLQISQELRSVTYQIGSATGGRRRGL